MGSVSSLKQVILFDGVCNLCNGAVLFVIKRDKKVKFSFASLQSSFGQIQLKQYGLSSDELSTIVLLKDGRIFTKSTAALEIAKNLDGLWPAFYFFRIVPPLIRNFVYDFIAQNRYRWFGKREACMIPTPELKARFIEI
ncbi:MAG: thiol-disulfide oxidoreductase DCC family protein [Cyclobacteriaceae bacterium]|jgi:predicted DCC family thiol-disulfide oxidoreductase YuxK|nr:thiol-disulfide oxidoreductase DCC family protein [Cyclobacteriaceae bacterium]